MSNFKCSECGMINIDCGKEGYKTPREFELEKRVKELEERLNAQFVEMEEKLTAEEMKNFELKEENKRTKRLYKVDNESPVVEQNKISEVDDVNKREE